MTSTITIKILMLRNRGLEKQTSHTQTRLARIAGTKCTYQVQAVHLFLLQVSEDGELALLSDLDLSAGGSAEGSVAVVAGYGSLGVRENDRDRLAVVALDLEEVGVGGRDSALELVALLNLRSVRCFRGRSEGRIPSYRLGFIIYFAPRISFAELFALYLRVDVITGSHFCFGFY